MTSSLMMNLLAAIRFALQKHLSTVQILQAFPELALYKPEEFKTFWWGSVSSEDGFNERILALLFAHEMAKN